MDSLSFSPSLLSILSLLNRRDLFQCRLVSRRVYDVINSNRRIEPKRRVNIQIRRGDQEQSEREQVVVNILDCRKEQSMISINIDNQSICVVTGKSHEVLQYAYEEPLSGVSIADLFEGLQIVLTPLFRSYCIMLLNLVDTSTCQWTLLVVDLFKTFHTPYDTFQYPIWPCVKKFLSNCNNLTLVLQEEVSNMPPNQHRELLAVEVATVKESLEAMADLFKGWYKGQLRLNRVILDNLDLDCPREDFSYLPHWFAVLLESELDMETFESSREKGGKSFVAQEIIIRRPTDDVILHILMGIEGLYIYDDKYNASLLQSECFCHFMTL